MDFLILWSISEKNRRYFLDDDDHYHDPHLLLLSVNGHHHICCSRKLVQPSSGKLCRNIRGSLASLGHDRGGLSFNFKLFNNHHFHNT